MISTDRCALSSSDNSTIPEIREQKKREFQEIDTLTTDTPTVVTHKRTHTKLKKDKSRQITTTPADSLKFNGTYADLFQAHFSSYETDKKEDIINKPDDETIGPGVKHLYHLPTSKELESKLWERVTDFLTYAFDQYENDIRAIQKGKKLTKTDQFKKQSTPNKKLQQNIIEIKREISKLTSNIKLKNTRSDEISKQIQNIQATSQNLEENTTYQKYVSNHKTLSSEINELKSILAMATEQLKSIQEQIASTTQKKPKFKDSAATCVGFTILQEENQSTFCLIGCSGSLEESEKEFALLEKIAAEKNQELNENYFRVMTPPSIPSNDDKEQNNKQITNINILLAKLFYKYSPTTALESKEQQELFNKHCQERNIFHFFPKIRHKMPVKMLAFASVRLHPYPKDGYTKQELHNNYIEPIPTDSTKFFSLIRGRHQIIFIPLCNMCKTLTQTYLLRVKHAIHEHGMQKNSEPLSPTPQNILPDPSKSGDKDDTSQITVKDRIITVCC